MLPAGLISTYREYKLDTEAIATWLASTAKSAGYSMSKSDPSAHKPSAATGRRKGKARKEAKENETVATETASKKQSDPIAGPTYVIATSDFTKLAKFIRDKVIRVPRSFKTTINRAIASRTEFNAKIGKHVTVSDQSSVDRHENFVQILKEVRDTLSTLMPEDKAEKAAPSPRNLSNRFADLELHEPSQRFLDAQPIHRPTKAQTDRATYKTDLPLSPNDILVEFSVLVGIMNDIRCHIRSIWSRYGEGTVDLAAAAVATNAAHELVQNMIIDFQSKVKDSVNFDQIIFDHFKICCESEGVGRCDELSASNGQPKWNDGTYHVAEKTFFTAYILVRQFREYMKQAGKVLSPSATVGVHDSTAYGLPRLVSVEFSKDAALLSTFLADVACKMSAEDRPVYDEFYRRNMISLHEDQPFLDVAFAAQVFLDISHTMKDQTGRPLTELKRQLEFLETDLQLHFDFHKNLRNLNANMVGPTTEYLEGLLKQVKIVQQTIRLNRSFDASPMFSGLVLFYFRQTYYKAGLLVANCWGAIQFCGHVVNAMHISQSLEKDWLDLAYAQKLLGKENFFVGGKVPKTIVDEIRNFALHVGISPTVIASRGKRPRDDSNLLSKAGARGFRDHVKVNEEICRILERHLRLPLTEDQMEQIIQKSCSASDELIDEEILRLIDRLESQRGQNNGGIKTSGGKYNKGGTGAKSKICSDQCPERLVERLLQAVQREGKIVIFPYLHLHRRCMEALFAMTASCDIVFPEFDRDLYARGDQFYRLPCWLFGAATGSPEVLPNRMPLDIAAAAIEEQIKIGKCSSAFKIMTKLAGASSPQVIDNDLGGTVDEGTKDYSINKGGVTGQDCHSVVDTIFIEDGRLCTVKKGEKSSS